MPLGEADMGRLGVDRRSTPIPCRPPTALSCGLRCNPHASATPAPTDPRRQLRPARPTPRAELRSRLRASVGRCCSRPPPGATPRARRKAGQPAGGARPAAPVPVNRSKPRAGPGASRTPRRSAALERTRCKRRSMSCPLVRFAVLAGLTFPVPFSMASSVRTRLHGYPSFQRRVTGTDFSPPSCSG